MKKTIALLLAVMMLLGVLSACAGKTADQPAQTETPAQTTETPAADASTEAPAAESGNVLRFRSIVIDLDRHSVFKNGSELELTQREYELIKFLASNPGKVVSRQKLMSEVWQYDYYGDLRAVDVAVRRLREKVEDNPAEPEYVITKRGAGYYFNA